MKGKRRKKSGSEPASSARQAPHLEKEIRLNKFIAHAGLCSRRDADDLIEEGVVFVNGEKVTEHGVRVTADDRVEVKGQRLTLESFVYLLLNKSKDTISTTDDEKGRNTVMDTVEEATGHRIYPVGRLDRDTTGLLLLTNDGDLAHRMMHPSYRVKKVYEAVTSRPMTDEELQTLAAGIELEDGPAQPHLVRRSGVDPAVLEITVFEGRNHLVRRMIAYFGAEVTKLKRVRYAGLNLKGVSVGRWRYLSGKEVNNVRRSVKLDPLNFNKQTA